MLATNHMTATVTPWPWPGGTGCRWSSACPHRHSPGHLRAGAERGNTDWNPTPWCHPGICFIAALWSIAGVAFFRNYPGMQRQTESSLWSLIVASDLPKCQGGIPASGNPPSTPRPWRGLMGRDGCTCHWLSTDWLLQSHQNTLLMQPT